VVQGIGITELSQREPPIFGWAAITLGIGQHFSIFQNTSIKNKPILTIFRTHNPEKFDTGIYEFIH